MENMIGNKLDLDCFDDSCIEYLMYRQLSLQNLLTTSLLRVKHLPIEAT